MILRTKRANATHPSEFPIGSKAIWVIDSDTSYRNVTVIGHGERTVKVLVDGEIKARFIRMGSIMPAQAWTLGPAEGYK
jgi:hypothetical protein